MIHGIFLFLFVSLLLVAVYVAGEIELVSLSERLVVTYAVAAVIVYLYFIGAKYLLPQVQAAILRLAVFL